MKPKKQIQAKPQPNGDGHQITYECGDTRKVHHYPAARTDSEKLPHGAGSFHDPEHHYNLMDRVEAYLNKKQWPDRLP